MNDSLSKKTAESTKTDELSKTYRQEIENSSRKIKELEGVIQQNQIKLKELQDRNDLLLLRSKNLEEEKKQSLEALEKSHQQANKTTEEKIWIIRQLNEKVTKENEASAKVQDEKNKLQQLLTQTTEKAEREKKTDTDLVDSLKKKVLQLEQEVVTKGQVEKINLAKQQEQQLAEKDSQFQKLNKKYLESVQSLEVKDKQSKETTRIVERVKDILKSLIEGLPKDENAVPKEASAEDMLKILKVKIGKEVDQKATFVNESKSQKKTLELVIEQQREESDKKIQELNGMIQALKLSLNDVPKSMKPKFAFSEFKPGDFVLFLSNQNNIYEAYSWPSNHFLSQYSLDNFEYERKQKEPIVGQVVEIEGPKKASTPNPYKLSNNADYWEVVITKET